MIIIATIRDVAKKAGVSVATVSRVMNNKGKTRKETRLLVEQAVKDLSYTPNMLARGLSNRKSNAVALVLPTITNPFFPEIARAVEDIAREKGYKVLLCNTDDKRERLLDYITSLSSHYVAGIIVSSHNIIKEDIDALSASGIPVVMMDRVLEDEDITSITVKNRLGGRMATQHLVDVGCERIAHIGGLEEVSSATYRLWGYRDVVSHLPWFDASWTSKAEFSVESGYQAAKELFYRHPDIDGIFCSNDLIAIGVLKAAYEWGKKVPNELAIVGFDGIDMSGLMVPGITTIAQPKYEIGALAMEELINHIENKDHEPINYELDLKLILRESTMRNNG